MADFGPAAAISISGVTGVSSAINGIRQERITRESLQVGRTPEVTYKVTADDDRASAIH